MNLLRTDAWKRKGIVLLWNADALSSLALPNEIVSLRQFFAMAKSWSDDYLRSNKGSTLVVAGLDGCLDTLSPDDASSWLMKRFLPAVLSFQSNFESAASLVFWLPNGKTRIKQNAASESYNWLCSGANARETIEIGRILWGGAEKDAARILNPAIANQDPDGPAWIGICLQRMS